MAENKRQSMTKTLRFEVFKRDSFTCQYCGRSAPNVVLEVDHIIPVAKGGKNELINLITSCRECNRGKGKRTLSDKSVIDRQKKQLDELNEMREQTEMMIEWKRQLMKLEDKQVDEINDRILVVSEWGMSDIGRMNMKKLIHQFGFPEVYTATEIALDRYFEGTYESMSLAFSKIGGICYNRKNNRGPHETHI